MPVHLATNIYTNLPSYIQPFIDGSNLRIPLRYYEKVTIPSGWRCDIVRGTEDNVVATLMPSSGMISRNILTGGVQANVVMDQIRFLENATSNLYDLAVTNVSGETSSIIPSVQTINYDFDTTIALVDIMPRGVDEVSDWSLLFPLPRLDPGSNTIASQFNQVANSTVSGILGQLWIELTPRTLSW